MVTGLQALRPGGTAVMVGLGAKEMSLPVQHIMNNELTVTGIFRYAEALPKALAYAQQPTVDLGALVTEEFRLEDTAAALQNSNPMSMKSIVVVSKP